MNTPTNDSPANSERDFSWMDAHQRVTGPFEGFFIASYGCCIDELADQYIGSFKICETRPLNYWKANAKFIGWCSHTEPTSLAAMELAEATAQQRILHTFLSPDSAPQSSAGAAMDIFPASYWAARRRARAAAAMS